ncbi:MAG: hypothetical protein U1E60_18910 [Reyranellaceae bacterium]
MPRSTFLDAFANQLATPGQFATLAASTSLTTAQEVLGELYAYEGTPASVQEAGSDYKVTIGLMLERANDPTALLASDWATRQSALADQQAIWNAYGADPGTYASAGTLLTNLLGADALAEPVELGYVSSAADRMIWLTLDASQFAALFGTDLLIVDYQVPAGPSSVAAWAGQLALAASVPVPVVGLWVEQSASIPNPAVFVTRGVSLPAGPLGVGNAAQLSDLVFATPTAVAANYAFPLAADVTTPAIALVEQNVATQAALFSALNEYRTTLGLPAMTRSQFQVLSGTDPSQPSASELTLDISVLSGAAPSSTQLIYSTLTGTPFNAYQQAFFDDIHDPAVLSSSYGVVSQSTAGSPFQRAWQELFVDGALANVSAHIAAGDKGSSAGQANGLANYVSSASAIHAVTVGGTSIAGLFTAKSDPTLSTLLALALQDDPATVFQLVAAGLRILPSSLPDGMPPYPSPSLTALFETVWQNLTLVPHDGALAAAFDQNYTGSGGVNSSVPVPDYQTAFGLLPSGAAGPGRGAPDVSALSSGDARYAVLNAAHVGDSTQPLLSPNGGTSAASPLWASLTAQIDAVFADQGLPRLGFYNDLLYTAAAIFPASFNDVVLGNNTTSYYLTGSPTGYLQIAEGPSGLVYTPMVPTGLGTTAAPGYDLTSGLGTPNGLLLARTLTAIAQAQSHSDAPPVIDHAGLFGGVSVVAQTLLVQNELPMVESPTLQVGNTPAQVVLGNAPLAWTDRLAGQAVQGPAFDADLVTLLDTAGKSIPYQIAAAPGDRLDVRVDDSILPLYQAALTAPFGFVRYGDATGIVVLARPVAIAQTAGGDDSQETVVRLRQDGRDSLQLQVYRVDNLEGTIAGVSPGQPGYAAAATARAYHTLQGTTTIDGPGYGSFAEVHLATVDQGDVLAMKLTNTTTGNVYWSFSEANSGADASVSHLYGYGLNTWGWEDQAGGGDHDYNDLVVQLDFTSASGLHHWLV